MKPGFMFDLRGIEYRDRDYQIALSRQIPVYFYNAFENILLMHGARRCAGREVL